MSSWLQKFHDFTGEYDPLNHALVDGIWKSSTGLVNETSRGLVKGGEKLGINTSVPEYGRDLSQKDKDSFSRWGENTLGSIAAIYGGMSALGGDAAGAGAGGATEGLGGAAGGGAGGYAEAGGGFVGNGEFLGPHSGLSGSMNPQMFAQAGRMFGGSGSGQQQADMQRQQAMADYLKRQQEQNAQAAGMPGWVYMQGAY